jgi:GTP pyrophosphokinase
MNKFRDLTIQEGLLKEAIRNFNTEGRACILRALELAKEAHNGQKRDEGDPYIIHPIRVANTLIYNLGIIDCDMVSAGLLHDVVEDTEVPLEEIQKRFGERVAEFVEFMTRDKEKETKKEKYDKIILESQELKVIKACDWLDNLRSCVYRVDRGERWQRHLREDEEMYLPLAKIVGDKWLIAEMIKAHGEVLRVNARNQII